jgi:anti-anti-sigma factor
MLEIGVEKVLMLSLNGRLELGPELGKFRRALWAHIGHYRLIVLDMAKVARIDAAAVGALAYAYNASRAEGSCLLLCNVVGRVREILLLVRLLTVFGDHIVDLPWAALERDACSRLQTRVRGTGANFKSF